MSENPKAKVTARMVEGRTRIIEIDDPDGSRTTYSSAVPNHWLGIIHNSGSGVDGDCYFGVDRPEAIVKLESMWQQKEQISA